MSEHIPVEWCEDEELPIPTEWRRTLSEIVECLESGDLSRLRRLSAVAPLSDERYLDIQEYVRSYGCKLSRLPDDTWRTSIYLWMRSGGYWEVLVDL